MNDSTVLTTLMPFRSRLYARFLRRADALMDLSDALLTTGPVLSPAHLSLAPAHRRGQSLYRWPTAKRSTPWTCNQWQEPYVIRGSIYTSDNSARLLQLLHIRRSSEPETEPKGADVAGLQLHIYALSEPTKGFQRTRRRDDESIWALNEA